MERSLRTQPEGLDGAKWDRGEIGTVPAAIFWMSLEPSEYRLPTRLGAATCTNLGRSRERPRRDHGAVV
jgi:hypothetical protein